MARKIKDNKNLTAQDYVDFSKADLMDLSRWEKEKKKKEKKEEMQIKFRQRLDQPLFGKKPKTRTGKRMKVSVPQGIKGLTGLIK